MKTLKISLFAIMLGAFASSCSKTGATGPEGPAGPPGADGVANIGMVNYLIDPNDWTSTNFNEWYYVTGVTIPTTDFVNVYISSDGDAYTPLATSSFFASGDLVTYVYGNGGNLTLWVYFSSAGPTSPIYAKVADIPPAAYVKHPNTNWNNYNEVAALPEVKVSNNIK